MRTGKRLSCIALLGAASASAGLALGQEPGRQHAGHAATLAGSVEDAWIDGKLEGVYTLNRHLNPFTINTDVDGGVVTLTGTVESDIDRDLAVELAKGIEGVAHVESMLEVRGDTVPAERSQGDFSRWVDDVTTTAAVKSRLLGNANVQALAIDVDTQDDVVTLRGQVGSAEERELAEQLARNSSDVSDVINELQVARNP